jgi:Zn-dependent peptidase ImmA (M78 family)
MVKLKINHRDVPVLPLSSEEATNLKMYGYYEDNTKEIYIENILDPTEQARVLLHEIIHALFHIHQVKAKRFTQEGVCQALDVPLATLFRDNPHLGQVLHDALNRSIPIVN